MALQYSTVIRNAKLDAVEATIGASAILRIRTGAQPATVATASSGSVLATLALPADWMAAASGGTKAKSGTWEDTAADASGTAAHFEIVASDTTTVGMRGSCSVSGGGGDMILDSVTFTAGQAFSITSFTLTSGNA